MPLASPPLILRDSSRSMLASKRLYRSLQMDRADEAAQGRQQPHAAQHLPLQPRQAKRGHSRVGRSIRLSRLICVCHDCQCKPWRHNKPAAVLG